MYIKKELKIEGMVCSSCEIKIREGIKNIKGVSEVQVSIKNAKLNVCFDTDEVGLLEIVQVVENMGYKAFESNTVQEEKTNQNGNMIGKIIMQVVGVLIIFLAVNLIASRMKGHGSMSGIDNSTGYGLLFLTGLMTSIHCIAMCGGINLSQCLTYKNLDGGKLRGLKPGLLYNTGRVISYTIIGGIIGATGSAISVSGGAKSVISIFAGALMIIMGLNLLNIFPWLRGLSPKMPRIFRTKLYNSKGNHGSFFVGLLNGLMPCGPLQSMQIYALGTGSFFAGAASMFMFSMGTVPLMFGFGALSTILNKKVTGVLMKVSAVLVSVLGMLMLGRGLNF